MGEVPAVIRGQVGRPLAMSGGGRLDQSRAGHPLRVAQEVDGTRWAGGCSWPEQPDVAIPEAPSAREALERHLDGTVGGIWIGCSSPIPSAGFGFCTVWHRISSIRRSSIGSFLGSRGPQEPGRPVVDVLGIQAGVGGHEQGSRRCDAGARRRRQRRGPAHDGVFDGPWSTTTASISPGLRTM